LSADARLFIAVDPPASVQAELARWTRSAISTRRPQGSSTGPDRPRRTSTDGIRRVDASALHLTLCFLGDQPLGLVDEITEILGGAIAALALRGASVGPLGIGAPVWLPPRRPRALALEVHDESGGLTVLHEDLRAVLGAAIAWEPERRRLRPHITVARLRSWAGPPGLAEPTPPLVFEPPSVTLYRSRLAPDGATYQALARVGLEPAG
jgi:RNA 2',3'-cyclic 3'-phosphodiesterase